MDSARFNDGHFCKYQRLYTDKKEDDIFLIFKEIQMGSSCKVVYSMRKVFLIYEEMRKYLTINEKADSHIWLCNWSQLNFLIYEEDLIFIFIKQRNVVGQHQKNIETAIFSGAEKDPFI